MTRAEREELNRATQRLNALRTDLVKRCPALDCGRVISGNKEYCAEHAQEKRLNALGIVLPGVVILPASFRLS
jgi:hypothetical protein